MTRKLFLLQFIGFAALILPIIRVNGQTYSNVVTDAEWQSYKTKYNKVYPNAAGTNEAYARYYYTYHKALINAHNLQASRGLFTYKLALNQFSDMRFITFRALFPQVTAPTERFNTSLPNLSPKIPSYDPRNLGLNPTISDQGTVCNSGWAYATAKAVEILKASEMGNMAPEELSAQNLIDCAGRSRGCTNQHPQIAFDYLTEYEQEIYQEQNYKNDNTSSEQNMCIRPTEPNLIGVTLTSYAYLNENDDTTLERVLPTNPVVIEYDPTSFQFMHYSEGIFQKPASYRGSHFLTVVGYGNDASSNKDYWLALNSFGNTWGEEGYIKILRTTSTPITKSAIVPLS